MSLRNERVKREWIVALVLIGITGGGVASASVNVTETIIWNGDGSDDRFGNPENWVEDKVPDFNDRALISNFLGQNVSVEFDAVYTNHSIRVDAGNITLNLFTPGEVITPRTYTLTGERSESLPEASMFVRPTEPEDHPVLRLRVGTLVTNQDSNIRDASVIATTNSRWQAEDIFVYTGAEARITGGSELEAQDVHVRSGALNINGGATGNLFDLRIGGEGRSVASVSGGASVELNYLNVGTIRGGNAGIGISGGATDVVITDGTGVGTNGSGVLRIFDGGKLTSNGKVEIGKVVDEPTGVGEVSVSGRGIATDPSLWRVEGPMEIGIGGRGQLLVEAGAVLESGQDVSIGSSQSQPTTVIVDGAQSLWDAQAQGSATAYVRIGDGGSGRSELFVRDEGLMRAHGIEIGTNFQSTGLMRLENGGDLITGAMTVASGGAGRLEIDDGEMLTQSLDIYGGFDITSGREFEGVVELTNGGLLVAVGRQSLVGAQGRGELTVRQVSEAILQGMRLGGSSRTEQQGHVLVTGADADLTLHGSVLINRGSILVASGGEVDLRGVAFSAWIEGQTNLVVSGESGSGSARTPSTLSISSGGNRTPEFLGEGTTSLSVSFGGKIEVTDDGLNVAVLPDSQVLINVAGEDSLMHIDGEMFLSKGIRSETRMTVEGAGTARVGDLLTIGTDDSDATLTITSGASFFVERQGRTVIGDGDELRVHNADYYGNTIVSDGQISGNGTVHANVTNNGSMNPGGSIGTLAIDGNYEQGDAGRLVIEIDGLGNDVLDISGTAKLGGTLEIVLGELFVSEVGDHFTFLQAESIINGIFDETVLPPLFGNRQFAMVFTDTSASITVIPEPSTIVLTALAAPLLYRRRQW